VDLLQLRRNVGHQRAIALGLAYLESECHAGAVIVMDSDGEDDPRDIPRLVARWRENAGRTLIFAERTKRSEGWLFVLFYRFFRLVHRILTGRSYRVGNFSLIPSWLLRRMVVISEVWNHYAGAAFKARLPVETIPTTRGKRLAGRSKMNLASLVLHGISALSIHSEVIGLRMLFVSIGMMAFCLCGFGIIFGIRLGTNLAIPGWATVASGVLSILLLQLTILAAVFLLMILRGRSNSDFIPSRDFRPFLEDCRVLWASAGSE